MSDPFVTAQHAAEAALLKMALRSLLARAGQDDAFAVGLRIEFDGGDDLMVELIDPTGAPCGGFSL